jgi:energy-coupling factor transporter ATP-binding protein EcfA2
LLKTRTWVDLRGGVDADGLQDLVSAITGTPRRAPVAAAPGTCPYRGLEVFEEEHAGFFFGREDDTALLVETLKTRRFLAVLGPSGSGKSSVLRAGLVPALRSGALAGSEDWPIRVFTPGRRPLTHLATHVSQLLPGRPVQVTLDQLSQDQRSLDLAASAALVEHPRQRLVLVIDQLEELFTLCPDEHERRAFLSNLLYASGIPGGPVVVVIGLRADFYDRCARYPDLRSMAAASHVLVGPLDAEQLRRVIEEPARHVGLEVEAGLVETILADVGDRPGTLPLLEHLLLEVWRRRRGTMLTLEAYVAAGGVHGALAQRADGVYSGLTAAQQATARGVFLRLVQPGEGSEDTRRRAEMHELVNRPGAQEVEAVVQAFAEQRLLTVGRDDASGATVVDIAHEALIRGWPALRGWIDEAREELVAERHLTAAATEWGRTGRRDEDLYGVARLAYWDEHGDEGLTELERAFLQASHAAETRRRAAARRRVRLGVAGALAAVTAVAAVALAGQIGRASWRERVFQEV